MAGRKEEFPALTGLRGVAALAVTIFHFVNAYRPHHEPSIAGSGYLGVDLFFILSGFLMTRVYSSRFTGPVSWSSYGGFLWRRVARVYPAYITVTLIALALSMAHIMFRCTSTACIISNAFLLQNTGIGIFLPAFADRIIFPAWSLSTEAMAYLAFPCILALVGPTGMPRRAVLLATISLSVLLIIVSFAPAGPGAPLDLAKGQSLLPLVRCFADYVIGVCTLRLRSFETPRQIRPHLGLCTTAVIVFIWWVPRLDIVAVPAFAILTFACADPHDRIVKLLSGRVALFLGIISYSLYLVHGPSLDLVGYVQGWLGNSHVPHFVPVAYGVVFLADIAAAYILFKFIEGPAQQGLQKLASPRRMPTILTEPSAP